MYTKKFTKLSTHDLSNTKGGRVEIVIIGGRPIFVNPLYGYPAPFEINVSQINTI